MTPYDLCSLGGHRGMLVDINLKKLIRYKGTNVMGGSSRNLFTAKPDATKKYLEAVEKGFQKQRLVDRITELYRQWSSKKKDNWDVMRKYEKIDAEVYQICQKAEKQCKSAVKGKADWSPALNNAIKKISYWRACYRYRCNNAVVQKLGQELQLEFAPVELEEVRRNIVLSRQELTFIQKHSVQYRRDFLECRAEIYAQENNCSSGTAIP